MSDRNTCPGKQFVKNVTMYTKFDVNSSEFTLCEFCYDNKCLNNIISNDPSNSSFDQYGNLFFHPDQSKLDPKSSKYPYANCNCPIHREKNTPVAKPCLQHLFSDQSGGWSEFGIIGACPECKYFGIKSHQKLCLTCAVKSNKCFCGKDSYLEINISDKIKVGTVHVNLTELIETIVELFSLDSKKDYKNEIIIKSLEQCTPLLRLFPDVIHKLINEYHLFHDILYGKQGDKSVYTVLKKILTDSFNDHMIDFIVEDGNITDNTSTYPRIISTKRYNIDYSMTKNKDVNTIQNILTYRDDHMTNFVVKDENITDNTSTYPRIISTKRYNIDYSITKNKCVNTIQNILMYRDDYFLEVRKVMLSPTVQVKLIIYPEYYNFSYGENYAGRMYTNSTHIKRLINDKLFSTLDMLISNKYSYNLNILLQDNDMRNIIDILAALIKIDNYPKIKIDYNILPLYLSKYNCEKNQLLDHLLQNSYYFELNDTYYCFELILLYYIAILNYIFNEEKVKINDVNMDFEKNPCLRQGVIRSDIHNFMKLCFDATTFPKMTKINDGNSRLDIEGDEIDEIDNEINENSKNIEPYPITYMEFLDTFYSFATGDACVLAAHHKELKKTHEFISYNEFNEEHGDELDETDPLSLSEVKYTPHSTDIITGGYQFYPLLREQSISKITVKDSNKDENGNIVTTDKKIPHIVDFRAPELDDFQLEWKLILKDKKHFDENFGYLKLISFFSRVANINLKTKKQKLFPVAIPEKIVSNKVQDEILIIKLNKNTQVQLQRKCYSGVKLIFNDPVSSEDKDKDAIYLKFSFEEEFNRELYTKFLKKTFRDTDRIINSDIQLFDIECVKCKIPISLESHIKNSMICNCFLQTMGCF